MWRYREMYPVTEDSAVISFQEGYTPLLRVRIEDYPVFIKQDHLFPSGSYKDRGASVLLSYIKEHQIDSIVEDSSGNAGSAIAAYAARAGVSATIFVPEHTSEAKLAQIRAYGSTVEKIAGTREDTARAAYNAVHDNYYASHSWNPLFFHGTKSFAYEICEQNNWRAPDAVIIPTGNGTLLLGAFLGFSELHRMNIIEKMPKLIAVQSNRCAPLYELLYGKTDIPPGKTIAEGIAIAEPVRKHQMINAIKASGGEIIIVDDDEISASLETMSTMGFYIEPTSAAAIAGLKHYLHTLRKDEMIVTTFTGHGLKSEAC
jgi:threonine synthase